MERAMFPFVYMRVCRCVDSTWLLGDCFRFQSAHLLLVSFSSANPPLPRSKNGFLLSSSTAWCYSWCTEDGAMQSGSSA